MHTSCRQQSNGFRVSEHLLQHWRFEWSHRFIVHMKYEVTFKPTGRRFPMEEGALYWVRDGKIVREEFFYHMG